jgi:hypothetical protein
LATDTQLLGFPSANISIPEAVTTLACPDHISSKPMKKRTSGSRFSTVAGWTRTKEARFSLPDSLQLLAPNRPAPNPIRQDPNFLPRERRTGRHLQLSFMPQDVNHQALLRISGHYSRSPGSTFQQIIPADKRQIPVIQLLVMARQAPPGQDGGNFSIEELLIRSRREQEREHNGDHFFLPTPN